MLSLTDSAAAPKKPKCPPKWFESGSCCYFVGKKRMTFLKSQKFCKNRNFNGTQTQLAPLVDLDELLDEESMRTNLKKPKNNCKKSPCKWWIQNVENEEDSEVIGPCVELVQFNQGKLKVHKHMDCFKKRRPLCARHLMKEDDLEE